MNKIVQAHFFIFLFCFLHQVAHAQKSISVTRDPESKGVSVIPIEKKLPELTTGDPTSPGEEIKKQTLDPLSGPTKNPELTKKSPQNSSQKNHPGSAVMYDKYGNIVQPMTREEKAKLKEGVVFNEDGSSMKVQIENNTTSDQLIYTNFEVTAIKEEIPPSYNVGTERIPKSSEVKTTQTETPDTANKTNSTIGKVEFLKQYVIELRSLIEKNKNTPNYPLAEKQKELQDIENLLKQE
jgi:hypothetical protein